MAELKATGEYQVVGSKVFGICKDCVKFRELTPDHKRKRSQGGGHEKKNIDWVCVFCHDARDNQGDPMNKKPEKISKKANWATPHHCKSCGRIVSMFLCNNCGKASL